VNRASDKLLSGTGFTFDQSGRVSGRDRLDEIQYLSERPTCSDDVLESGVQTFALDRLKAFGCDS
jgi:hypothetical protein